MRQKNLRITEADNQLIQTAAKKCNLSESAYLRMLIRGYAPKASPPLEYEKLMQRLNEIAAELSTTGKARELVELLLQIQAEMTLPERIDV